MACYARHSRPHRGERKWRATALASAVASGCIAALMATATAAAQNFVIEYDSLQRDSAELSSASFSFEGGLTPLSAQGVSADFQMRPLHCENNGVACAAPAGSGSDGGGDTVVGGTGGGGGGGGRRNLPRREIGSTTTPMFAAAPIAETAEPLEEPPEEKQLAEKPLKEEQLAEKPPLPIVTVTIREPTSPTLIEDVSRAQVPVMTALPRASQYTLAGISVVELGVLSRLSRIYAFRNLYGAIPAYAYGWGGISVLPLFGRRKRWKTRRVGK